MAQLYRFCFYSIIAVLTFATSALSAAVSVWRDTLLIAFPRTDPRQVLDLNDRPSEAVVYGPAAAKVRSFADRALARMSTGRQADFALA